MLLVKRIIQQTILMLYRLKYDVTLLYCQAQRERIIASRNERRIQLEERIEANNKKIEDHHAGIAVLNDNQLQHLMRRNDAFIHQVEHMAKELDEEVCWLVVSYTRIVLISLKTSCLLYSYLLSRFAPRL